LYSHAGTAQEFQPVFFAIFIPRGMSFGCYGASAPIYFCGRTGTSLRRAITALVFYISGKLPASMVAASSSFAVETAGGSR